MTDVELINTKLAKEYSLLGGPPLYRIVWSDTIMEHRHGTFRDYCGKIFLREVTETRLTRKYGYIHERWILEKWAPGELTRNRETPGTEKGDYIPMYVFEDSKGNYLPPTMKSVEFMVAFSEGKIKKDAIPSQEYLDEKEIQQQVESMDTHPIFQTAPGPERDSIGYNKGLKNVS
jgi:hypothetical protein